ncbi:TetR family transcriptional regulator [Pseudonocardia oroxyli]|uniref:Transcriptional regulator, TetR family n=1 Tax=Pseudonocardia oroxyli TaxID=366584 RepID=A0A1G7YEB5_PSEOR|nr:TetR family transcriptional regulator [Pseudonocardia oroxyli]SDG94878.1 transcriptional regulator, TetR family [Pseudonocardia oroxyli]
MSTASSAAGRPDTRSRLLDAAEALFAERGSEAVSLREIGRAAGARNVIAAQYWFTDRDGLVRALIERHAPEIEAARHAQLDEYEDLLARGAAGSEQDRLHLLAGALARPPARKLEQGVSGAGYLRTVADLLTRPEPSTEHVGYDREGGSIIRWRHLLEPLLDPDAVVLHRRFYVIRFVDVELAQRSRAPGRRDHRLFVSQLVDSAAGLLGAATSDETRRLRAERG